MYSIHIYKIGSVHLSEDGHDSLTSILYIHIYYAPSLISLMATMTHGSPFYMHTYIRCTHPYLPDGHTDT